MVAGGVYAAWCLNWDDRLSLPAAGAFAGAFAGDVLMQRHGKLSAWKRA